MLDPSDPPPPLLTDREKWDLTEGSRIMRMQAAVCRWLTACVAGWCALAFLIGYLDPAFDVFLFALLGVAFTMFLAVPFMTEFCFPVLKDWHKAMDKSMAYVEWELREHARREYKND